VFEDALTTSRATSPLEYAEDGYPKLPACLDRRPIKLARELNARPDTLGSLPERESAEPNLLTTFGVLPFFAGGTSGARASFAWTSSCNATAYSSRIFSGWNGPELPSMSLVAKATASAFTAVLMPSK
jgi:hypothetical protein